MRETVLIVMCILFVVCYFKVGTEIGRIKPIYVLYIAAMTFMFGILVVINLTLINQNDVLIEKTKNKCPEYEQINNVYIIKKK